MSGKKEKLNHVQIAFVEKIPIIYERDGDEIKCYTEEIGYHSISVEYFKDIRTFKTKYILVNKDGTNVKITKDPNDRRKKIIEEMTLKEIYDEFIRDADELKRITKGVINMYKSGRNSNTVLNLAYHYMNKKEYFAEPITYDEMEWLEGATMGALIFSDPGYKGPAVKLDINSAYPYLYSSVNLMVPFKAGIFMTVTEIPSDFFKFGIWRAVVEYPDDTMKWKKLFKLNSEDKYTHYELNHAKNIGLKITLIVDDEPNHLHYPRDYCISASQLFGNITGYLYNLRPHPIVGKRCKLFLNILWGILCQKDECTFIIDPEKDEFPDLNGRILYKILPLNDGREKITTLMEDRLYCTNWARMKPFLLSKGRVMLSRHILPHVDNCYRAHTDSFVIGCSKDNIPPEYKINDELGGLKIEDYWDNCSIEGLNKTIDLTNVENNVVEKKVVKKIVKRVVKKQK